MLFTSHHMTIRMLLLSAVIVFSIKAYAQHRVRSLLVSPDRIEHQFLPSLQLDSLSGDTVANAGAVKSPAKAVLLSALLPGAGQIYTGRYWKVPIILGFGGYFVGQWIRANDLYLAARTKYSQSVEKGENGGQGNPQFVYERDFYRDERDKFAFYFAITYLLNIVDAYVGASLYGFEVKDDLGGASVKLSFPIR
ncbi:MAG TPA: hypothetical protein DCP63_06570 [Bacteroidetes bacterium]|nr:hypothetical protein [Bacteroidota bacterium]